MSASLKTVDYLFMAVCKFHMLYLLLVAVNVHITAAFTDTVGGMLYPRESETREVKDLNGMWNFRADVSLKRQQGFSEKWYTAALSESGPVIPMPVPSSYNDITQDKSLRDFIGWVWYDREFYVPFSWTGQRVILRLESVRYYSMVWVNGVLVAEHEMGHLPFEADLGPIAKLGVLHRLTVAVNNTLTPSTLPPGKIQYKSGPRYPKDYFVQVLQFGFFNYAGIDRPVKLYTTPTVYVDDITLHTDLIGSQGMLSWVIMAGGLQGNTHKLAVEVVNKKGRTVAIGDKFQGQVKVNNVLPWWPYSMNETSPGYMYTLKVTLSTGNTIDIYRQPFGFRTVSLSNNSILVNHRPFYCHGVAKHEDHDVRGKGLDLALVARDFSLLRWLGVNCFRTSHYPYAEEIMDEADRLGIVVIDECPAIGLIEPENFNNRTLSLHVQSMRDLVRRDKNRPAVIMWSIGNEPRSTYAGAGPHFGEVIKVTKQLDPYRPITFASSNGNPSTDHVMNQVDVVCVNIYFGWYSENGHTEVIEYGVEDVIDTLHTYYNKPVMVTEYGAESLPGLHVSPSFAYSEEYQRDLLAAHHNVFDKIKGKTLAGEMIWNFADFLIDQEVRWPYGCHKGLFTRQRQPKFGAHIVRQRYHKLMNRTLDRFG